MLYFTWTYTQIWQNLKFTLKISTFQHQVRQRRRWRGSWQWRDRAYEWRQLTNATVNGFKVSLQVLLNSLLNANFKPNWQLFTKTLCRIVIIRWNMIELFESNTYKTLMIFINSQQLIFLFSEVTVWLKLKIRDEFQAEGRMSELYVWTLDILSTQYASHTVRHKLHRLDEN